MSREESIEKNNQSHQLRLSIDFKSLKDHQFTANLYLKYSYIPDLGIKNFRSAPSIPINQAKVQTSLDNCFQTYYSESTGNELQDKINKEFRIELWHNDRLKKDVLLGVAQVQLKSILQLPLRRVENSYARIFDAYVPVDQLDEQEKPVKQIATLRVLIYLEDLGPVGLLKQRGFDIKNFIEEDGGMMEQNEAKGNGQRNINDPRLPSQHPNDFVMEGINEGKRLQLNELEYKVVWELETWKKAEEAKTKITLKQKEIEFWTNLSEQQKKSDLQKEKQFKKLEANLNLLEGKLKAKMNDLTKRQQKIIVYEQQLQSKMNEVSKELLQKDEEIDRLKKRQKDEKTSIIKEKSQIEIQLSKYRAENAKLRVELEQSRKQDERSPLNIMKNELNHKNLQLKQLANKYEKCLQTKEQFKEHYEKFKNQVISLKSILKEKDEALTAGKYEYALLQKDLKNLEQQLTFIKHQQQQQQGQRENYYHSYNNYNNNFQDDFSYENVENQRLTERERLIRERQKLIDFQQYDVNDELIKQYDRQIAACK